MVRRSPLGCFSALILLLPFICIGCLLCSTGGQRAVAQTGSQITRPQYDIAAHIDYDLLLISSRAVVTIPASAADPLADASFFLFANADGVGGDDSRRKNLLVDKVTMNGVPLKWSLDGAVLKVALPGPQSSAFALTIDYHGKVPQSAGGDNGMMGALSMDISSLLGASGSKQEQKPKNTDYGLYGYADGVLSLGSFWYPQLAVRSAGKWIDAPPEGLGDVAFSEKSDYKVTFSGVPANVIIAAPGKEQSRTFVATDVREFATLMSEDYLVKSKMISVGGRPVKLSSYALKSGAARLGETLDIAEKALQIYSKRFGAYPADEFKVVAAPMKGGAGGMEYSGLVGIATMLYGDFGKQLGGMMTTLDLPGADQLLKSLDADAGIEGSKLPKANAPKEKAAAPDEDTAANPMADMVGGILGQQKDLMDSLFEVTIAHEVAHQWWAIGVGSDSQRHPFVDESLTNWSAMLYFEDRYGPQKAEEMADLHLKTSFSMGVMLGGGDAPANRATSAYQNNMQYGAVIYGKGALFYSELRKLVGDQVFFASLREYFAAYNDRIADQNALRNIVAAKSGGKKPAVEALYKRWVEEAHGKEDIGSSSALGGLDLNGMLGTLFGGGGFNLDQ